MKLQLSITSHVENRNAGRWQWAWWVLGVVLAILTGCIPGDPYEIAPLDARPARMDASDLGGERADIPSTPDKPETGADVSAPEDRPTGTDALTCLTGQIACGDQCVDPNTSNEHCGRCGNRCAAGMVCARNDDAGTASCQRMCPTSQALCGDQCVATDTDTNNCGACGNVCRFANASATCGSGACVLGACAAGFENCDGMPANGCEVNTLTDTTSCGSCGNGCAVPNATARCANGACAIAACNEGFADCNANAADGCEVNLATTLAHCGRCNNLCSTMGGRPPVCVMGECRSMGSCVAPLADCNGDMGECEVNTSNNPNHCGACGAPCSTNGGSAACNGGVCSITCGAGFGDCDRSVANGCEVPLNTDVQNCGACGNRCALPNATESCASGVCRVASCNAGYANCDRRDDNGCEQATQTDNANCGACGNACPAAQVCRAGACVCPVAGQTFCAALARCVDLQSDSTNCGTCGNACAGGMVCQSGSCRCPAGTTQCGAACVNTQTDTGHCGMCNRGCNLANATAACARGGCVIVECTPGSSNCDGDSSNGCETDTRSSNTHCGACGRNCGAGQFCSNGMCVSCGAPGAPPCPGTACGSFTTCGGTCRDLTNDSANCGACGTTCASGQTCCGGTCRNLTSDTANCGNCGRSCPTPSNASSTCAAGQCGLGMCTPGFANCDGDAMNGCEANLNTSPSHCGGCNRVCPTTNSMAGCSAGTCTVASCNTGFGDCDRNAANGCEVDTRSDPNHCNACGMRCTLANVATATCASGVCGVGICTPGFANCDNNAANGCEINTSNDTANCGQCGRSCNFANAGATCSVGVCLLGACNPGFANCDGNAANGCEANLNTNNLHCGACGRACSVSQLCVNGACVSCGPPGAPCCSTGSACTGGATCGGGVCVCPAGLTSCGTTCVNLTSDSNNCGACGRTCATINGAPGCGGGSCTVASCNSGYGNCDGAVSNGCETNLSNTIAHCGACGATCSVGTRLNVTSACVAGACLFTCNAGYGDCDGNPTNGCEAPLTTATNCGACSRGCVTANATGTCATGTCMIASCNLGYADLDGIALNGCERSFLPILRISSGNFHTCAVLTDGTARCWGANHAGQLGNGGIAGIRSTPTAVVGLSGVADVVTGEAHTCARLNDGTVRCWGNNLYGQLGDGSFTSRSAPVAVSGLAGVVEITAGLRHTCARLNDGTVRCWGESGSGRLGNGGGANSNVPVVVTGLSDAAGISAGGFHTCANRSTGTVSCWGYNYNGQLGRGNTTDSFTPVAVLNLANVAEVTAGSYHTCARLNNGTVSCWGDNYNYQLGVGTLSSNSSPTSVTLTGLSNVIELEAGGYHTCARLADATVRCWGMNRSGQIGNGSYLDVPTPVSVMNLSTVQRLSGGISHTCAVLFDGTARCWGGRGFGELGNRTVTTSQLPVMVTLSYVSELAAGFGHTCALSSEGFVRCWGYNSSGQLGNGSTTNSATPVAVTGLAGVAGLAADEQATCAVLYSGVVRCWGNNDGGQLGDGSAGNYRTTPVTVQNLGGTAVGVTAGRGYNCAWLSDQTMRCWGSNFYGQFGSGNMTSSLTPVASGMNLTTILGAVAGGLHTCAWLSDGGARCWGYNNRGQVGNNSTSTPLSPNVVMNISNVAEMTASLEHSCARLADGTVRCWGENSQGQLGNGFSSSAILTPVNVLNVNSATRLAAGNAHTCALRSDQTVQCWGSGSGSTPSIISGITNAVAVAAGYLHTCTSTANGPVYCWGYNTYGQLGNGSTLDRSTPVTVVGIP